MRNTALLFLLALMPCLALADESCERIAQKVSTIGLQSEERGASRSAEDVGKLLAPVSPDECDLMVACSGTERPDECSSGIRQLVGSAADNIGEGDVGWANLAASLVQYTDGEITAELLAGLSYLLPERPDALTEVIAQNPHIKQWTRSIVDPAPDLREIEDRCTYFANIASSISDSNQTDVGDDIAQWASESYDVYRCDQ